MAMNKKEKQQLADAIEEAELAKALRWTEEVTPDVPPPIRSGDYSVGWIPNWHTGNVEQGWSDSHSHGYGAVPVNSGIPRHGRQNPRGLFSSQERALRYIRHMIENEAAIKLRDIDRRIKAAQE